MVTVGTTTANIQCDYNYIATLKKAYLFYGEGTDEADYTSAEMRVVQNTLYVELTGLKTNTTYNYYYEFHNGFNSMRTALKSFNTEALPGGVSLPTVITAEVTEISTNSAKGGGEVTNDGGTAVTERGVCWSTNDNPTMDDSHIDVGSGMGAFTAALNGLKPNVVYHVRAYAINEAGIAYGLDKTFSTVITGTNSFDNGVLPGLFSVSSTKKVQFSQGNLQYQASTNTWRFAEHQWDYVGGVDSLTGTQSGTVYVDGIKSDNTKISSTYDGWIDLFGWGTSGYNHGAISYQPWSIAQEDEQYYAYGSVDKNLNDETMQADWGYNPIINGSNDECQWRTMTGEEWKYLLFLRSTISGVRFARARVNGTNGVIIFPDDWELSAYPLNGTGNDNPYYYHNNEIPLIDWLRLELDGAVFLPTAGFRKGTACAYLRTGGYYSTATKSNEYDSYSMYLYFYSGGLRVHGDIGGNRSHGRSVRLVQDANP